MAKWLSEWVMVSALLLLGLAVLFVMWAIWPLLPARLPAEVLVTLNFEAIFAMLMLLIILIGFGKILTLK